MLWWLPVRNTANHSCLATETIWAQGQIVPSREILVGQKSREAEGIMNPTELLRPPSYHWPPNNTSVTLHRLLRYFAIFNLHTTMCQKTGNTRYLQRIVSDSKIHTFLSVRHFWKWNVSYNLCDFPKKYWWYETYGNSYKWLHIRIQETCRWRYTDIEINTNQWLSVT